MILVNAKTGVAPKKGDVIVDFRGDKAYFVEGIEPTRAGSTGRVVVADTKKAVDGDFTQHREYYPSVYGLCWKDERKEVK